MQLTTEHRVGGKKLYLLPTKTGVRAIIDCDLFNQFALVEIPMTMEQALEIQKRLEHHPDSKHIQDILPELPKELREVFISGTTPAEWDETMNDGRKHWRHYRSLGYKFDHDMVSPEEMDAFEAEKGILSPQTGLT